MSFRELHVPGKPFILANAWDLGSAKLLVALGAQAIATSSAAHAFTLGQHDLGEISREDSLAHARALVAAVPVPVSGDLENGYAHDPQGVADTIQAAIAAGLAGASIEDIELPSNQPYAFADAVARIEAAVAAARSGGADFVLTARADGVMHGTYDLDEAIRRLRAFAVAGADVLYVPLPGTLQDQARVCAAVDAPVNALCAGPFVNHSLADFARIGVARISLGAGLARITHRVLHDSAQEMFQQGRFDSLAHSISGSEVERLMDTVKVVDPGKSR